MDEKMPAHSPFGKPQEMTASSLAPRTDYPALDEMCYLNAAGIGLIAQPVQDAVVEYARSLGTFGTRGYFQRYDDLMEWPRRVAAELLSAPVECIGIITSISEAISQIALWRRPRAGENVAMVDSDCSSATYPWLRAAEETGAEMRFVDTKGGAEPVTVESIARLVDDRTAAISVSSVQWIGGERLDLVELGRLARHHDALLVIDATHSFGVVPFTPDEMDAIDFLAAGSFKWLGGFAGAGAVYVHPRRLTEFRPVLTGSRTSHPEPPFDEIDPQSWTLPPDARRFEYGSSITLPRLAMAAAGQYLLDLGIGNIAAHNQRLGDRLMAGLEELGAEIFTPRPTRQRAGIVCARFTGEDQRALYDRLVGRQVHVSLRAGNLRFSPHVFNHEGDIDRALEAIACETAGKTSALRRNI